MQNSSVFDKEEKMALTKVVKVLKEAGSTVMTICFNCKVDEKVVIEKMKGCSKEELKDSKTLAKEILTGKESTVIGRLSKTENNLGRSLIVGVGGFKQFA
jgi:hypothetical protein